METPLISKIIGIIIVGGSLFLVSSFNVIPLLLAFLMIIIGIGFLFFGEIWAIIIDLFDL